VDRWQPEGRFKRLRRPGGWIAVVPMTGTDETAIEESAVVPSYDGDVSPVTFTATPVENEERPTVSPVPTGHYLRIENNTAVPQKIRIQYANDQGKWEWLTTGPEGADRPFEGELQAGKDIDLSVEVNRIRVWAESSSGLRYKDWSLHEVGDSNLVLLLPLES
jgi:hypothetical protein